MPGGSPEEKLSLWRVEKMEKAVARGMLRLAMRKTPEELLEESKKWLRFAAICLIISSVLLALQLLLMTLKLALLMNWI
jgi:hypothetical protein